MCRGDMFRKYYFVYRINVEQELSFLPKLSVNIKYHSEKYVNPLNSDMRLVGRHNLLPKLSN